MSAEPPGELRVNEVEIRVRFAETDAAGVYHHANVFSWFEVGRFDLLEHLMGGFDAPDDAARAVLTPVTKARAVFKRFGHFNDRLIVQTFLKREVTTKVEFYYNLKERLSGRLVALGYTQHVALHADGRIMFRWPDGLQTRIDAFAAQYPYALVDGKEFDERL